MLKETDAFLNNEINGLKKVWITNVAPEIDGGAYPAKCIINDTVGVFADIFSDGSDELSVRLQYRHEHQTTWSCIDFFSLGNDRWEACFPATQLGVYHYTLQAWSSEYLTWKKRFLKKLEFNEDLIIEKEIGAELFKRACTRKSNHFIDGVIGKLGSLKSKSALIKLLANKKIDAWMRDNLEPDFITAYPIVLAVVVDPVKARFSSWYELFPRSMTVDPGTHGTLQKVINYLPELHKMGFDVLYLPPIHPIGIQHRKGANNNPLASEGEPGSPWAIGSAEGAHKHIHPQLGTLDDFRDLVKKARHYNIDIALDFAIQCSPDHPYVSNHPQWFKQRPDGSLQYAENPPKKYQDIYPIHFSAKEWPLIWEEFKSVILFWVKEGVNIFRVDNPHTKPFIFWQWLIRTVKADHPQVLFLAEAFTRPKIMQHLAKCGFSQSYTYYSWRNTKEELIEYLTELNTPPLVDYFRPNFWPNTPDILSEFLQKGGRPAFIIRFLLAATLCANYGIYGPAYENCIREPHYPGSEEYLNSEKYQIVVWEKSAENISELISLVNAIRHAHKALQNTHSLIFYPTDNPKIICYSKHDPHSQDLLLMVINLDYEYKQSAFITMDLSPLGVNGTAYTVHDLLSNELYHWHQGQCYVELSPLKDQYAHIFKVQDIG